MVTRKRRPPRALFYDVFNIRAEDYQDSVQLRLLLYKEIPLAIFDAISTKKNTATVFEINNTSNYVEIPKECWSQALEWSLTHYIEQEDYVSCSKIKSTIDKLTKK